jgi:hypothetical protein
MPLHVLRLGLYANALLVIFIEFFSPNQLAHALHVCIIVVRLRPKILNDMAPCILLDIKHCRGAKEENKHSQILSKGNNQDLHRTAYAVL